MLRQPARRTWRRAVLPVLALVAGTLTAVQPASAATANGGTDLSGRWLMQYTRPGLNPHPYSVLLSAAPADECGEAGLTSPCFGGSWWNITGARTESRVLFAAERSGTRLVLTGVEGNRQYHYQGSSAATGTPTYAGTFDNVAGTTPATFTLAPTPYAPGQQAPLSTYSGSLDLTGDWQLAYTPRGLPTQPFTISLKRAADDLCSGAHQLGPACYGGAWYNVNAGRFEGRGYFAATLVDGQVHLRGADEVSGSPQHYDGTAPFNPKQRLSVAGTFDNAAGTAPATFTLTAGQATVLPASGAVVQGSYVVVLKTPPSRARAAATARAVQRGVTVTSEYRSVLSGFAAKLSAEQLDDLRRDQDVAYISPETNNFHIAETNVPWGLDRIDQRSSRNGSYLPPGSGDGVTVYVIDSGVAEQQPDFTGPNGSRVHLGHDFVDGTNDVSCVPHGTSVADVAAGKKYGMTYRTQVVSLRVARCDDPNTPFIDEAGTAGNRPIADALDWVGDHHRGPSVVNMSIGPSKSSSFPPEVTDALVRLTEAGVTVVISAGNDGRDACDIGSISADVIVVGAIDQNDQRSVDWNDGDSSNYGPCVDLYAPGSRIPAITPSGNMTLNNGTSFAAPHVAGAAALYLQAHPDASPHDVKNALVTAGTSISVMRPGESQPSPARLLHVAPMRLSSVDLTFDTPDGDGSDDKDADTDASFYLLGASVGGDPGPTLASLDLPHEHFSDGTSHGPYGMQVTPDVGLRDLRDAVNWRGVFTPHGGIIESHDTWTFTMIAALGFTGGQCGLAVVITDKTPNSGGTLEWPGGGPDNC